MTLFNTIKVSVLCSKGGRSKLEERLSVIFVTCQFFSLFFVNLLSSLPNSQT